jgi:hypothetical protein
MRILAHSGALFGLCFVLGFVAATVTSREADWGLLILGITVAVAIATLSVILTNNPLAAPAAMFASAIAGIAGNYLPYAFEIGDLRVEKYGSDDMPGSDLFWANVYVLGFLALLVGAALGVVVWAVAGFVAANRKKGSGSGHAVGRTSGGS